MHILIYPDLYTLGIMYWFSVMIVYISFLILHTFFTSFSLITVLSQFLFQSLVDIIVIFLNISSWAKNCYIILIPLIINFHGVNDGLSGIYLCFVIPGDNFPKDASISVNSFSFPIFSLFLLFYDSSLCLFL